jgi:hypothetical protein
MAEIILRGSYGELTVHRTSGHIVGREHSHEYSDILWFDPARLPDDVEGDILGAAFVCEDGLYITELVSAQVEAGYYEWVDQLRLPAS